MTSILDEKKELSALQGEIGYARMLVSRLERLSVDSYWAHRSSGLRGSLLRALEDMEARSDGEDAERITGDRQHLKALIDQGSDLLERAAREIQGDEPQGWSSSFFRDDRPN